MTVKEEKPQKEPVMLTREKLATFSLLEHPKYKPKTLKNLVKPDEYLFIHLVRRPSCSMCTIEGKRVGDYKDKLNEIAKVKMISVCKELVGAEDFANVHYRGDLFVDAQGKLFDSLKLKEKMSWMSFLLPKKKNTDPFQEGHVMGGGILLAPDGKEILFQHYEYSFGLKTDMEEVMEKIKEHKARA